MVCRAATAVQNKQKQLIAARARLPQTELRPTSAIALRSEAAAGLTVSDRSAHKCLRHWRDSWPVSKGVSVTSVVLSQVIQRNAVFLAFSLLQKAVLLKALLFSLMTNLPVINQRIGFVWFCDDNYANMLLLWGLAKMSTVLHSVTRTKID